MAGGDISGPKAIAKRIKAKGLGRLRWYCQMCEKQCRDENGFKCHTNTPAHQRQLALFVEKPDLFVERFSKAFLDGFLDVLRQRYGSNPVAANAVYQDYIKDKQHIHMNSTQWVTLTEFVTDLGRRGICRVEDRDGLWWLTYVDREVLERKQRAARMERARLNEEEHLENLVLQKMRDAPVPENPLPSNARVRKSPPNIQDAPITVTLRSLGARQTMSRSRMPSRDLVNDAFRNIPSSRDPSGIGTSGVRSRQRRNEKKSVLDEIIEEEMMIRAGNQHTRSQDASGDKLSAGNPLKFANVAGISKTASPTLVQYPQAASTNSQNEDAWLMEGIVVKLISESLRDGPFHGKKGIVLSLRDRFTGVVKLLENGALLESDQDDLQTVIPKPGGPVIFVRGPYREMRGVVMSINEHSFCASVRLMETDSILDAVEYEDICKVDR